MKGYEVVAKRRKKEQLDPVQSLVLLLMLGSFFGVYLMTKSFAASGVAAGCILGVYLSIVFIVYQKRTERLKRSGIVDIDKMTGRQFEIYLGHLFQSHGYKAEVTQSAGDYGADLILSKGEKKIVVQAKRYSKNVGLKAVQEIHTAMNHYGALEAWVVTNSDYTEQAYTLAKSNGVRLINRQELIELILVLNTGATMPSVKQVIEQSISDSEAAYEVASQTASKNDEHDNHECPKCGYLLVKRKGSRGEFYGCSNFPKCRHTLSI